MSTKSSKSSKTDISSEFIRKPDEKKPRPVIKHSIKKTYTYATL